LFADGTGAVERISVDLSGPHFAHVLDALDTTPRAEPVGGSASAESVATPARDGRGGGNATAVREFSAADIFPAGDDEITWPPAAAAREEVA
jgi:hypothetical protein